jgi:hypothetical protein
MVESIAYSKLAWYIETLPKLPIVMEHESHSKTHHY